MATLTRNIHFFRALNPEIETGKLAAFDPKDLLEEINGMSFATTDRYHEAGGKVYCAWIDRAPRRSRFRYAVIRRDDLPRVERGGKLRSLAFEADEGLVEQIHVVWFRKNIVGCDFNFYGPRLPSLSGYLSALAGDNAQQVRFEPLVRQDIANLLDQFSAIRMLHLRVRRSDIEKFAGIDDSLKGVFDAQAGALDASEFELIWRPKAYSRGEGLGGSALSRVKKLAKRDDVADLTQRFVVEGLVSPDEPAVELNVLDQHLIVEREIERQRGRGRSLRRNSAYEAITSAYKEIEDELLAAASVEVHAGD